MDALYKMDALYELRIVDGPVAAACWILASCGTAALCWVILGGAPFRPARLVVLTAVSLGAVALTATIHWLLVECASVFPENLPGEVLAASGFGLLGLLLGATALARIGPRRGAWGQRGLAVASAASTALLSGQMVNAYFGLSPTLGDLVGRTSAEVRLLERELRRSAAPAVPLAAWVPPAKGLPHAGELRTADIPGTASGFRARPAYIYLPPAYFADTRPELPVLLLMSGQPGNPSDWLTGGRLKAKLDRFAAEHAGVAPVGVVVDPLGSPSANTLCMDTKLGAAESYLVHDVVPWIKESLSVAKGPEHWASAGFSFGGTCAVQLLAKHPELVHSALGFAAEEEPALAKDRSKTIGMAFDGDAAAFDAQVPAHHFATRRLEGSLLFLAVGSKDHDFVGQARVLGDQARTAGAAVEMVFVQGEGHSWEMIAKAWGHGIRLLAERWGIG
ncbi:alpha/beta hydrolase [Sinomonas susongensis]|uniref:alpha/beta hydrolase n=1 Tax=Sinomonas susongensis TaxID=1324851 RepID=UPI0011090464|nr:alpha/beta hydrolase-fold protein [Sinomonas susongensis]